MSMSKIQRTNEILQALYERGHLEVREISQRFDISEATVRRDLRRMADAGQLELVYGGATLPQKNNYSIRSRQARNIEAKRIVGQLAASLVRNGDSIFLDSGTTCACMVPYLLRKQNLDIITNSNLIAAQLGEATQFNILQLGGRFRFDRMDSVGPFAQMLIEQLSGYHAFIGADGLTPEMALTSTDIETAHLYRSVIRHAAETTLVVDHSKFASPALYKITEISSMGRLVTDGPLAEASLRELEKAGISVYYPGSPPEEDAETV